MDDNDMELLLDPKEVNQNKKGKWGIIGFLLVFLFLMVFVFEIITGHLNLYLIHERKEPYFLISENTYKKDNKIITTYNFGIYKIIEVESETETKTALRIWFADTENL